MGHHHIQVTGTGGDVSILEQELARNQPKDCGEDAEHHGGSVLCRMPTIPIPGHRGIVRASRLVRMWYVAFQRRRYSDMRRRRFISFVGGVAVAVVSRENVVRLAAFFRTGPALAAFRHQGAIFI
jgi:hypothetical protein